MDDMHVTNFVQYIVAHGIILTKCLKLVLKNSRITISSEHSDINRVGGRYFSKVTSYLLLQAM